MPDIYSYIHCDPLVRKCRELRRSFDEYEMAKIIFDSFCPLERKHAGYHGLQRLVSERPERRFRRLERELEKQIAHDKSTLLSIRTLSRDEIYYLTMPENVGCGKRVFFFEDYTETFSFAVGQLANTEEPGTLFFKLEKCKKHIDPLADYPEVIDTVIFSGDGVPYTTNRLREDPHPTATDAEICSGAADCKNIVPFQNIYVDYPVVFSEFDIVTRDSIDPDIPAAQFVCTGENKAVDEQRKMIADRKRAHLYCTDAASGEPVYDIELYPEESEYKYLCKEGRLRNYEGIRRVSEAEVTGATRDFIRQIKTFGGESRALITGEERAEYLAGSR